MNPETGAASPALTKDSDRTYPSFSELSAAFWDLTGFDLDLVEMREDRLTHCFHCVRNDACRNLLTHPDNRNQCKAFLMRLCAQARQEESSVTGLCHAGLTNRVLPLNLGADREYFLLIGRRNNAGENFLSAANRLLEGFRPLILERLVREETCDRTLSPLVEKIVTFLECHFSETVHLDTLARHFNASPFYLSRRFSKEMGMPLFSYLNRIRVDHAKHLLEEAPEKNITQICYSAGFTSISQFNRTFRSQTGLSPSAYRRRRN